MRCRGSTVFAAVTLVLAGEPFLALAGAEPVWVPNQGARLVIGQESFTRQSPKPSREVLGAASGVAFANNRLFVADGNRLGARPVNNRILIYSNVSGFVPRPEDVLLQDGVCPVCIGLPDIVLGQPDFDSTASSRLPESDGLNNPSAVASDGLRLAVADTNNNRVLLWNQVPILNDTPPDLVLGQDDLTTKTPSTSPSGMRGPQGVWLADNKLFVADSQNSRVLIWNSIPTSNGQPPDVVVGQPDLDTRHEADLTQGVYDPDEKRLLDPVSVTVSEGMMFVADLGFSRVLIYFSVPTVNFAPADLVIGQPDFTSNTPNNSEALCEALGPLDDDGSRSENETFPSNLPFAPRIAPVRGEIDPDQERYPRRCERTLSWPRFAFSDGQRLFVADSGNDRILVFDQIPTENAPEADLVIGQPNFVQLTESDGPGSVRSPSSMAYDGQNLYVADPFSRRILVFTPGEPMIDQEKGIRNAAAISIHGSAHLEFDQELPIDLADTPIDESQLAPVLPGGEEIKITLDNAELFYTTVDGDTAETVRDKVVEMINNDPDLPVTALPALGIGRHATGAIRFGGEVRAGDVVTLDINGRQYSYTVPEGDIPERFVDRLNHLVDSRDDPEVIVERKLDQIETLELVHKSVGPVGNSLRFSISITSGSPTTTEVSGPTLARGKVSYRANLIARREGPLGNFTRIELRNSGTELQAETSGSQLRGGSDARDLPPGTIASIFGEDLAGQTVSVPEGTSLPTELAGVQVFANGRLAPILMVSEEKINFQVPWELEGTGYSFYVRRTMPDGGVKVSAAHANQAVRAAPGLFAYPGLDPRRAVATHGAGVAEGSIGVAVPLRPRDSDPNNDDTENRKLTQEGAEGRVVVNGREYYYRSPGDESEEEVRDKFIELINAGEGDPDVIASAGTIGFFSARADIVFEGEEPKAGDTVTVTIRDRSYSYTLSSEDAEGDTALVIMRNILVRAINAGHGDPEVTARVLQEVGNIKLQIVARSLGSDGNSIPFGFEVSPGAGTEVSSNRENGFLEGGNTPPAIVLTARRAGKEGNSITFAAKGTEVPNDDPLTPDVNERTEVDVLLTLSGAGTHLCCGNEPYSPITEENPLVPGELMIVFATGLGKTDNQAAVRTGEPTPVGTVANVPLVADDFVSSQFGGRTAQVEFVGLAENQVGVYQVNLRTNTDLVDNPETPLWIAQGLFISNTVTLPVKNLVPRPPTRF